MKTSIFILIITSQIFSYSLKEIIKCEINNETLIVVSNDDYLYYPYGFFSNIKEMGIHNKSKMEKEKRFIGPMEIELYKLEKGKSQIKFILNDSLNEERLNRSSVEIYNGELKDKGLKLNNGIEIGINLDQMLSYVNYNTNQIEKNNITCIELISGVTGIWHFYVFKNDTLNRILFITDYSLGK